jgi:phosphohistidine phosphatase
MKTLVLIRHAKSSWKFPELKDAERPLKKRGLKEAPLMGKVLKDIPITPDRIVSSPAVRAQTTAQLIAKEYGIDETRVLTLPGLYMGTESQLLQEIRSIGDDYNVVFLIGHNPGLMDLAVSLTGEKIENLPTGGAFGIEFHCHSWEEAGTENAKKIFFEFPKKHRKNSKEFATEKTYSSDLNPNE